VNRRQLADQFSSPGTSPWKTFVVEAHPNGHESGAYLADVFEDAVVETTEDVHLHTVTIDDDLTFAVDDLDSRFWSFHSTAPTELAVREIKRRVTSRRDLDFVWLPSHHLRQIRPGVHPSYLKTDFRGWDVLPPEEIRDLAITVRGRDADRLLEVIRHEKGHEHAISIDRLTVPAVDPALGHVDEAVNRFAHFIAKGDSFALHQQVVSGVVGRYRSLVEAAEARAIRFTAFDGNDGGGRMSGSPIEVRFSRPLPHMSGFLDELFSSREPFRLWGLHKADDGYGECDGVDLHVGECIRVEAQPDFLRIYLYEGGCGNTIARLVANLQHHVDGALEFLDPELQDLLTLESLVLGVA
jgi:hypothetical protein